MSFDPTVYTNEQLPKVIEQLALELRLARNEERRRNPTPRKPRDFAKDPTCESVVAVVNRLKMATVEQVMAEFPQASRGTIVDKLLRSAQRAALKRHGHLFVSRSHYKSTVFLQNNPIDRQS